MRLLRGLSRGAALAVLTIIAAVLVVGTTLVIRLPEIVRRVVVSELSRRTGRQVSLEDVDLNPFRTHLALKRFRIMQKVSPGTPLLEFERLDVRLSPWALFTRDIRLTELALTAPTLRTQRVGQTRFEFSDLLDLIPAGDPKHPSKWTVTIVRLLLTRGSVIGRDLVTKPPGTWSIANLNVEGRGISTRKTAPRATVTATGLLNDSRTEVWVTDLQLEPFAATLRVHKEPFPLTRFAIYFPPNLPIIPVRGTMSFDLTAKLERDQRGLRTGSVFGTGRWDGAKLARPGESDPFLTAEQLTVKLRNLDLVSLDTTLEAVEVAGLGLRLARDPAGKIRLLDVAPAAARPPDNSGLVTNATPAPTVEPASARRRTVRVERLTVAGGAITFADEAVSPRRDWRLAPIAVEGKGLTTASNEPPGSLMMTAELRQGDAQRGASVALRSGDVRLAPASASARASISRFDLALVDPYVPPSVGVTVPSGTADASLSLAFEQGTDGLKKGVVSGTLKVAKLRLDHRGESRPLAELARLLVALTRADLVRRDIALGAIEVDGLELHALRNPQGEIDLLALGAGNRPRAATEATVTPRAQPSLTRPATESPDLRLSIKKVELANTSFLFKDEAVSPNALLDITNLSAVARNLSWPARGPAQLDATMTLPGQGRLEIKGNATIAPVDLDFTLSMRGAVIEPFQPYLPFAAQITGLFNGDSENSVRIRDGKLTALSKGHNWIENLEVRDPQDETPPIRIARMDMTGIDFAWPTHAKFDKLTVTRPELHVVREADGSMRLRQLFAMRQGATTAGADGVSEPPPATAARLLEPATPPPDATAANRGSATSASEPASARDAQSNPPRGGGLASTLPVALDFGSIVVEDAYARFLDRSTTPAFSETASKFQLTVDGISTDDPSRRTRITAQGLLGETGALDVRGEVAPFSDTLSLDVSTELREFTLADLNPYADQLTSWIIRKGTLTARTRYQIEGKQLTAANDVVVGGLEVERSKGDRDEVKRRIGLPLGLIVALVKDLNGDIKVNVPISGTLDDPTFDWSDAVWTAVKNVVVNIAVSPFKAIGKLFTKGDTIESVAIDPVPFAPGSAGIPPDVERQVTRIADFMRKTPYVKVALVGIATTADVENLKMQALTARLQRLQGERRVRKYADVVEVAFRDEFPDDKTKPEAQRLAKLAAREPLPDGGVGDLAKRRAEAVREALIKTEGIQGDRILIEATTAAEVKESGDGHVAFELR